jgi:hypothetical protein
LSAGAGVVKWNQSYDRDQHLVAVEYFGHQTVDR